MCRPQELRRAIEGLLFACMLPASTLGTPQRAHAQEAAHTQAARLEARLDSLLSEADRLAPRAEAERRGHEASARSTFAAPVHRTVDGLTIRALPRDIEAATELFTSTWREVFAPLVGAPPASMAEVEFAYYDLRGEWNPRVGEGQGWGLYVQVRSGIDDRDAQAVRALSTALFRPAPLTVSEWLVYEAVDPRTDWLGVRRQLAATHSRSAEHCLEGDRNACVVTLGLRPAGWSRADVVRAWYDDAALRDVLARRRWGGRTPPTEPDATSAFLDKRPYVYARLDGPDAPERLARLGGYRIRHDGGPTTPPTRGSLWTLALELGGGADALRRLEGLDPGTPLETVLTTLSGRPLGDLVQQWRERLMSVPDPADQRTPTGPTLAWVTVLAVFSMTSSRWRLFR